MWTIEAYDEQGHRFPGFLATNDEAIASATMDRISRDARVSLVIASYRPVGWAEPAIITLEGEALLPRILRRQAG